jgi:cytochrome c553
VAALIEKGACVSCHGANFSKPIDPSYPKIAGQYADYLYVALKSYTVEGNNVVGRANPIMAGIAKQFKPPSCARSPTTWVRWKANCRPVPQSRFR